MAGKASGKSQEIQRHPRHSQAQSDTRNDAHGAEGSQRKVDRQARRTRGRTTSKGKVERDDSLRYAARADQRKGRLECESGASRRRTRRFRRPKESDRNERIYASRATNSGDPGANPGHNIGDGTRVSGVGGSSGGVAPAAAAISTPISSASAQADAASPNPAEPIAPAARTSPKAKPIPSPPSLR